MLRTVARPVARDDQQVVSTPVGFEATNFLRAQPRRLLTRSRVPQPLQDRHPTLGFARVNARRPEHSRVVAIPLSLSQMPSRSSLFAKRRDRTDPSALCMPCDQDRRQAGVADRRVRRSLCRLAASPRTIGLATDQRPASGGWRRPARSLPRRRRALLVANWGNQPSAGLSPAAVVLRVPHRRLPVRDLGRLDALGAPVSLLRRRLPVVGLQPNDRS